MVRRPRDDDRPRRSNFCQFRIGERIEHTKVQDHDLRGSQTAKRSARARVEPETAQAFGCDLREPAVVIDDQDLRRGLTSLLGHAEQ